MRVLSSSPLSCLVIGNNDGFVEYSRPKGVFKRIERANPDLVQYDIIILLLTNFTILIFEYSNLIRILMYTIIYPK